MRIINLFLGKYFGIIIISKKYTEELIINQICLLEIKKFILENPILFSSVSMLQTLINTI